MHSSEQLQSRFAEWFNQEHFPSSPATLYDPANYILSIPGKQIRPVLCLMGNELFGDLIPDAFHVASAIELFHNFTLIHDDILDKAPLRRGQATAHFKFGMPAALLAGDAMLVYAYSQINQIGRSYLSRILDLFNQAAIRVCEGQQLDMDFEQFAPSAIPMQDYLDMIEKKTSVLLACSLKMGAVIGGASEGNANHLYEFGKMLGMSFQVQDDLLDLYGDPGRVGKQTGGDILAGKKTFLLVKAFELADPDTAKTLGELLASDQPDKVERIKAIYTSLQIPQWAEREKDRFGQLALQHLEEVAVLSSRKTALGQLAAEMLGRRS